MSEPRPLFECIIPAEVLASALSRYITDERPDLVGKKLHHLFSVTSDGKLRLRIYDCNPLAETPAKTMTPLVHSKA